MGGMFGESKFEVLNKVPDDLKPKTILITHDVEAESVSALITQNAFTLPVIFKPDVGERGFMVQKISSVSEIGAYLKKLKCDFLIQDLVDLPLEFGVFYTRFPEDENGCVTSVVGKEMLTIIGDGILTIEQLILSKPRAKLQWPTLKEKYASRLCEVLPAGTSLQLVSIGNHALGTKFLNCNHLINEKLSMAFDKIAKHIDGFYFGRFDLRCKSVEDLYDGRVMILEVNGCGAEPAHIYQPGFSLFTAVGVLIRHWKNIDIIASQNKKRGVRYTSHSDAKVHYRRFKSATAS
jgi:hypothetical protein